MSEKNDPSQSPDPTRDHQDYDESIRIAHLTMLQGVITRMGANSFTLKALAATFGSAAIAIMASAETPSPFYPIAAMIPMIIFWLMDAQYLRLERGYRNLFDHVRRGEKIDPYSLDASPFMTDVVPVIRLALSWSVAWFYIAIFLSFGVIGFLILCGDFNEWCFWSDPASGCQA